MKIFLGASALALALVSANTLAADLPNKGLSKASVEIKYGNPIKQVAAVGEPPISSWQYQGFTVYFEGNHVIHAVIAKK